MSEKTLNRYLVESEQGTKGRTQKSSRRHIAPATFVDRITKGDTQNGSNDHKTRSQNVDIPQCEYRGWRVRGYMKYLHVFGQNAEGNSWKGPRVHGTPAPSVDMSHCAPL